MALTATEQKQIREALCAIAVRGARYQKEYEKARTELVKPFEALKVAAVQPAEAKKQLPRVHRARRQQEISVAFSFFFSLFSSG